MRIEPWKQFASLHQLRDLAQYVTVVFAAFGTLPDVRWLQRVLPKAHAAMRSNNRDVQTAMCVAGRGWAVLPVFLGDSAPGLVRCDLGEAPPSRDVWVGFHQDMRRLVRLRRLLEFTVEALAAP
jgi:DNA-binding transcriptional LysR family regulator